MLLPQERFDECYSDVKSRVQAQDAQAVLVFVAMDCDALCACKMLTVRTTVRRHPACLAQSL